LSKLKKDVNRLVLSKELLTIAPDDDSLKRLVARCRVFFDAVNSRMWN
jgi:hypothetical protein